jgi:hypothetical protein
MYRRRIVPATLAISLVAAIVGAAAAAPFPARIALPPGFMPEGITSGPGPTIYVGSLAGGAIWRGSVVTGGGDVFVDPVPGRTAVGTEYEAGADRLWVAGGPGPTSEVRVYDASSGNLLQTYPFSPAGFLNDLVVTGDAVYVTDSANAWLNVIPLGPGGSLADPADAFMLPLAGIDVVAGEFNLNGIVEVGGWLVVVQSNTGLLFRVDPATGQATEIATDGIELTFGDGLEFQGSRLYVVRNQVETIAVLDLAADLSSATLLGEITAPDDLDVPTTATVAAGRLWAVNARFGTTDPQPAAYWVTRLPARP